MKRADKTKLATEGASITDARAVPMMVPHCGAGAGSDFESAFDVVRRDAKVHKLWKGESAKHNIRRVS